MKTCCFGNVIALLLLVASPHRNARAADVSVELVSRARYARAMAGGDSGDMQFSADGRWSVFISSGDGLVTNDHNGLRLDVFLRNRMTGEITLISKNPDGVSASGDSTFALISDDGRKVVFESDAPDLVAGDQNDESDVFLFDTATGEMRMLSQTDEAGLTGEAHLIAISPDARFVLFQSTADDLVPDDTNEGYDLFLLDLETSSLTLITKAWDSTAPAAYGDAPPLAVVPMESSMSADGRFVAYASAATNLVSNRPDNLRFHHQIYLWDSVFASNRLVFFGTDTNVIYATSPVVSDNGMRLAFLVEEPTKNVLQRLYVYHILTETIDSVPVPPEYANGTKLFFEEPDLSSSGEWLTYSLRSLEGSEAQIYLYNVDSGTNVLISRSPSGEPGNSFSSSPIISRDGRVVIFTSSSSNLTSDTVSDEIGQLFAFDRQSGRVELLSRGNDNTGADSEVIFPSLSPDGSVAAFTSFARNLATGDDPNFSDLFIAPTFPSGPVSLVSTGSPTSVSVTGNGLSELGERPLSLDGHFVVFKSAASDLVPEDTNEMTDVFLSDLWTGEVRRVSIPPDDGTQLSPPELDGISPNGRTVLYSLFHTAVVHPPNDPNIWSIYAYDVPTGTTQLASVDPDGTPVPAYDPSMTADGRYVAFRAYSGALCVRDLQEQTTVTVPGLVYGEVPTISPGGRYFLLVAKGKERTLLDRSTGIRTPVGNSANETETPFALNDTSLFQPDSNPGRSDVVLYSLPTLASNRLTSNFSYPFEVSADGSTVVYQERTGSSGWNTIFYDTKSGISQSLMFDTNWFGLRTFRPNVDGRFLVLAATNTLIEPGQDLPLLDIYLYDRVLTNLTLVSRNMAGIEANGPSSAPAISADGRTIVFQSFASDLAAGDLNRSADIFVARISPVDANQNGLEDGWEKLNFDGNTDPSGDEDNDGMTNLQEFMAGTNPRDAGSVLTFTPLVRVGAQSIRFAWSAVLGRAYQIQFKASLAENDWTDVGTSHTAVAGEITFETPMENPAGFYRLKAL